MEHDVLRTAPFDVITIADACVDLIVDLGETVPQFGQVEQWVRDYFLEMGGSTCIFACQAAKLGLRVGILGRVGDDAYGRLIVQRLQESGVDTRHMRVDPGLKTGLGLALCRSNGDRAILTYGGSLHAVYPEDITDEFLRSGRHLHYGSYYLQTHLLSEAPAILRRAKELGLTVSLDTNWDPNERWDGGLEAALQHVDLFFPNEQEALVITKASSVHEALNVLLERVATVAIKRGAQGALVGRRGEHLVMPVEPAPQIVDTIGAGDSFDAGFLAGWLRGLPLRECARLANACGRATIQARGGLLGQPTLANFPELVRSAGAKRETPLPLTGRSV
ncbi:MAG: sugar kinase [Anaerolineae bacterium]|nr:sugar kinase [Anaerolineae bacterium]MDW8100568.1 sugar kinase [Anaerolineae bacterium]